MACGVVVGCLPLFGGLVVFVLVLFLVGVLVAGVAGFG